jgi:deoxyribodipyrimidine photo-lyase
MDFIMQSIVIFEYSLKLNNKAFVQAITASKSIIPIVIIDEKLSSIIQGSNSEIFFHKALLSLKNQLKKDYGIVLHILIGDYITIINNLLLNFNVNSIYINKIYEPKYLRLYKQVLGEVKSKNIDVYLLNDNLLHAPSDINYKSMKGENYKVFTPFYNHFIKNFAVRQLENFNSEALKQCNFVASLPSLANFKSSTLDSLESSNTVEVNLENKAWQIFNDFISLKVKDYHINRDFPALFGNSGLAPYFKFGIISPNAVIQQLKIIKNESNTLGVDCFIKEIIWREFAYNVVYYYPHILQEDYKDLYADFTFNNDEKLLNLFKLGRTGYPIIDAGIKQLITTGLLHNRIRMLVASFFIKNLHFPWQLGAEFFMNYLIDADVVVNSVSWQWVAGTGFDSVPYFRIFNPALQHQKFDINSQYTKQFVKDLETIESKEILAIYESDSLFYMPKILNFKQSREQYLLSIKSKKII